MMRGYRSHPDRRGNVWWECAACGRRLAVEDPARPGVWLWWKHWRERSDRPGALVKTRSKRAKIGHGPDPVGTYSYPTVTEAECDRCTEASEPP